MVKLHVKKGDDSQFLFDTNVDVDVECLVREIVIIYNGRLKIDRICAEIEDLAEHGITLPPQMQGLTDEQIVDLRLKDEWEDRCVPSNGWVENRDKIGRRNGRAPNQQMKDLLKKTVGEAKALVTKKKAQNNEPLTYSSVKEALDMLRGVIMIVYPMGLPPHDPIHMELNNQEDLSGTQASQDVMDETQSTLWWAGKEIQAGNGKKLSDFVGKNDKTKLIVKLQKKGQGAPAREPPMTEEDQKQMMLHWHRKQEEAKKLAQEEDDSHLNSKWADGGQLRREFQGIRSDIKFKPGFSL